MHLARLHVSNFRAIDTIDVEFDSPVTVIIGPNAVGKTTILEAIRLAKSLLAPRIQNEPTQTLTTLGLTSPHLPQRLFPAALTNNASRPTVVRCAFKVEESEIATIGPLLPQMASSLALQSVGLNFANPAQAIGFLNSPQGINSIAQAQTQLAADFASLKSSKLLQLNLTINFLNGNLGGEFPVQQLFFATLEQALDPALALFSYFPADRAMPVGEQAVRIGVGWI
jgi:AAA domain